MKRCEEDINLNKMNRKKNYVATLTPLFLPLRRDIGGEDELSIVSIRSINL